MFRKVRASRCFSSFACEGKCPRRGEEEEEVEEEEEEEEEEELKLRSITRKEERHSIFVLE